MLQVIETVGAVAVAAKLAVGKTVTVTAGRKNWKYSFEYTKLKSYIIPCILGLVQASGHRRGLLTVSDIVILCNCMVSLALTLNQMLTGWE